tara:strand:- start:263 stop:832 length:570 start_codon:yes stop_codon:yes gene_type:complete
MKRIAVLGSTRGTNLSALAGAMRSGKLNGTIELVMSNISDALILERARSHGLRAQFIDAAGLSREDYDQRVSVVLHERHIDLIILIGYMRILSPAFVREWAQKIINVHPSLLPAFAGKMDLDVHKAVLASGVTETGCTIHYVTEEVDAGPIILQKGCPVVVGESPEALKARVQLLEGQSLVEAVSLLQA